MLINLFKLIKNFIQVSVPDKYRDEFQVDVNRVNVNSGKILSITFIFIEVIMITTTFIIKGEGILEPPQIYYETMYFALIIVMIVFLLVFLKFEKEITRYRRNIDISAVLFTTYNLFWCVGISLLDQFFYGQIIVYIIAIISIAVVPILKPIPLLIMYLIPHGVFIALLPYFQQSDEMLFGNYMNSTFFLILSWVISVTRYKKRIEEFNNKKLIEENSYELNRVNKELEEANEKLEKLSQTDCLTGILNRLVFDKTVREEWEKCKDQCVPLSLFMIDIDLFKLFNDNYGHQAGDECIRKVAGILSASVEPSSNIVARYGGEEFAIILPFMSKENAIELAEKLRKTVEMKGIPHEFSFVSQFVTISIGAHTLIPSEELSVDEFIRTADKALYKAKLKRNKIVCY